MSKLSKKHSSDQSKRSKRNKEQNLKKKKKYKARRKKEKEFREKKLRENVDSICKNVKKIHIAKAIVKEKLKKDKEALDKSIKNLTADLQCMFSETKKHEQVHFPVVEQLSRNVKELTISYEAK